MKKKSCILISLFLYFMALYFTFRFFNYDLVASPIYKIYFLVLCCLFIHYGGYFFSKSVSDNYKKTIFKINIIIFLILYFSILINITIFDNYLHRYTGNIFKIDKVWRIKYFNESVNLIPFHSIINYFFGFFKGNITFGVFFNNLFGNLILLFPLSVLLPLLSKKFEKVYIFVLTVILLAFLIEGLQLITLSGAVDIDDIILNTTGAVIGYKLFYTNFIQNFLNNYFYYK